MAQTEIISEKVQTKYRAGSHQDPFIMSTSPYQVTAEQKAFFDEKGFLIIKDALKPEEADALQDWAQTVHDLPRTPGVPWMPYEEVNASGQRVLCRTENYVNYHAGFNSLLRGPKLLSLLSQLAGEDVLLFKEKINYKLAGSGGFAPHIDSTAYTHVKNIKHLTILLAVDDTDSSNGGLDVVEGSQLMNVPINKEDNCAEPAWVQKQTWTPANLKAGQLLVFGSYLAHRSGPNKSNRDRKAIYATYNLAREGDLHDPYYQDRQQLWPATHEREDGKDYSQGALRYGYGSPMLSVSMGKQLEV